LLQHQLAADDHDRPLAGELASISSFCLSSGVETV
jgi:hypothetical protein